VGSEWITVQEAADYLGVARATIYKWAKQGKLPIYKLSERVARIRARDLERLLQDAKTLYDVRPLKSSAKKREILKKTKGAWADNPKVEEALAELKRGWKKWAEKL